jgi:hypothetical protein
MPTKEQDLAALFEQYQNTSLFDLIQERDSAKKLLKEHAQKSHRGNIDQDCSVCQSLISDLAQHNIVIKQRQQPPRP